jgi:NADH:ubiquinone oxidoreductase subunit 6 (subunit J)
MANILFIFGEVLQVLALIGLVSVLVWLVMTVLRLKNAAVTNAGRLYKRPLAAGQSLVATGKGIAQQETVRVKHIGASAKVAISAVSVAVTEIKSVAQTIHPDEVKMAIAEAKEMTQNVSQIARVAALLARAASKPGVQ